MTVNNEAKGKSTDPAIQQMIVKAEELQFKTVWDRYNAMTPQCGFGDTGLGLGHHASQ